MYDVTAGHEGPRLVAGDALSGAEVVSAAALNSTSYDEAGLSDAQLLAHAWMELEVAELAGATVLGRVDTPADVPADVPVVPAADVALDEVLEQFEASRSVLPVDQLGVRRERRAARRSLRTLGGVA